MIYLYNLVYCDLRHFYGASLYLYYLIYQANIKANKKK